MSVTLFSKQSIVYLVSFSTYMFIHIFTWVQNNYFNHPLKLLKVKRRETILQDGNIAGIGKAGNPDTMDNITPVGP